MILPRRYYRRNLRAGGDVVIVRPVRVQIAIALALAGCGGTSESAPPPIASGSGAGSGTQGPSDAGVAATADASAASMQPCPPSDEPQAPPNDTLTLTKATYADLPGWADDHHAAAIVSFLRSCEQLAKLKDDAPIGYDGHGGIAKQWRSACAAAAKVKAGDDAAAKAMFEAELVPWQAAGKTGPDGKLTGYNVTEVRGSRKKGGAYQTPMLMRPKDLAMVHLSL